MRDVKRRAEAFSFYDRTGMEAHLAAMAEKGWLLEKAGQFLWTYRRIEPKPLTFSVCCFPKASQFDPGPSEAQQTFYDFCAHTGWTLAASNAQLQIFYNEREDPVPIETDPALEVEAIHRAMKRSFLPSQLLLLAAAAMNIGQFLWRLWDDPIAVLSDSLSLFSLVCWPMLLLMIGVDLGTYFLWRHRARAAAERGEFLPTKSHPALQLLVLSAVLAVLVWSLTCLSNRLLAVTAASMVCMFGIIALIFRIREALKRSGTPAGLNRAVTFGCCLVLPLVMVALITSLVLSASSRGRETPDQLPLTVEELVEGDFSRYTRRRLASSSPLLAWESIHQWPIGPAALFPEPVFLEYEIIRVKAPFLYGLCRGAKLHERDEWGGENPAWHGYAYEPADPAPWGAAEAYRWTADGMPGDQFLLFYPDRIVEISFDHGGQFTPEQMKLAGERLGG